LANFVGCVVGFLNVCYGTPPRLLLAASLSVESEMVLVIKLLLLFQIKFHLSIANCNCIFIVMELL
jgi:hypothetical protein